ncbi:ATP-binding protein [Marinobacter zhejiangensis]|uniref:histidine kinase n=1 Tax=Marinobacter zhejiangensis TaxID=488535 RepID=A0A1I4L955_9GAMM|nr:ATP-binding protein [Marinobacter zhejiangensis]SFL87542.1 Signal transduction histidine kinase [Marinobacter zhejiangensis]
MSLKRQLLIASLLTLLIPWLGLQFVLELDDALRHQALQQMHSQSQRIAGTAAAVLYDDMPPGPDTPTLYANRLDKTANLDGYGDDWPGYEEDFADEQPTVRRDPISWQLGVKGDHLFLLLRVNNPNPVYFDLGQPERPFEHLRLTWEQQGERHERIIRTPAPGPVFGWFDDLRPQPDYHVRGVWQAHGSGYQVELQLPRPDANGGFGFTVERPDSHGVIHSAGGTGTSPLPRLVTRSLPLESALSNYLDPGQQSVALDPSGWVIARNQSPAPDTTPDFNSLSPLDIAERISLNGLRTLVRLYQPKPVAYLMQDNRQLRTQLPASGLVRTEYGPALMTTQPLPDGRLLILTQSLDQLLTLSGSTLGTVIARSTLLVIVLMLVLLGYSSWLSLRITRLQRAVNASVDADGRIVAAMPEARAQDELGELSRQFRQMIDKLQGYTEYLESFSRRLSHELKTPVAIVRSSLENLSHTDTDADQKAYLERVGQATDRLSQILQGMSEAARLEQSFDHAEHEDFDLAEVAAQASAAYQSLDPGHRIRYQGPASGCHLHGSPELLVQMLDKLVDNARDFTPDDGLIEVRVSDQGDHYELSVFNEGSSLPDHLASEIFNPFVSLRTGQAEGHLGQGLLIVRLIAEHHRGEARASNEHNGVAFTIRLPRH